MIGQIDIEKTLQLQPNKECLFVSVATVLNHVVDVVNAIQKEREAERFEIQEWIGILEAVRKSVNVHEKQIDELQMKTEPEKCEMPAENMLTMVDNQVTANLPNIDVGELAFLSKENTELKDEIDRLEIELERTRKALDKAKWWLHEIVESHRCTPISTAEMALEDITALEQKDK